jgi:putative membrane protein
MFSVRRCLSLLLIPVLLFGIAETAWADLVRLDRRVEWTDWNRDPVLLINLFIALWLYGRGLARIWSRGRIGRVVSRKQVTAFLLGMLAMAIVLVSPIDALGEQLAWVHMVQHMVLMTVAAPLIVLGSPVFVWTWGCSPFWRQSLSRLWRLVRRWRIPWQVLWQPLVGWSVYAAATWGWHIPLFYEAALQNPYLHDLQHVTFFLAACLYWRGLIDPISRFRAGAGIGVVSLFATTMQATLLGVLMTVSPVPWYAVYAGRAELWGMTPLEDQQLAGLIMWMPACLAYLIVAVLLLSRCLQDFTSKETSGSEGRSGMPDAVQPCRRWTR